MTRFPQAIGAFAVATLAALAIFAEPLPPSDTAFVESVVGAPAGAPLDGAALAARTEEVSHQLRCPVCQGSSVGDSPSSTARNMKQQVRELLAAGYSQEQVLSYFDTSYGEFVRLEPRKEGFTALVWITPVVLCALGAWLAAAWLRRRAKVAVVPADPAAPPTALPQDPELDAWLSRVRALDEDAP